MNHLYIKAEITQLGFKRLHFSNVAVSPAVCSGRGSASEDECNPDLQGPYPVATDFQQVRRKNFS